jgi:hypothetical protein
MLTVLGAGVIGLLIGSRFGDKRTRWSTGLFTAILFGAIAAVIAFAAGSIAKGDVPVKYRIVPVEAGKVYLKTISTPQGVEQQYRFVTVAGKETNALVDVTAVTRPMKYDARDPYVIIHENKLKFPTSWLVIRFGQRDARFLLHEFHLPPDAFLDRGGQ